MNFIRIQTTKSKSSLGHQTDMDTQAFADYMHMIEIVRWYDPKSFSTADYLDLQNNLKAFEINYSLNELNYVLQELGYKMTEFHPAAL